MKRSKDRVKPNFFIVGAPKCGTTAWVEYLASHPDIFFAATKEPHHFCTDFAKYRWVPDRQEYLELFAGSGSASIVGEASVFYLYSASAAAAIRAFNPDAKIIILIRNQEDFLPSLHNQLVFNGDERIKDFESAWRQSGKRNAGNIGSFCREPKLLDYKAQGRFHEQIERYFSCFSDDQIRVFHFTDWTTDPRQTYLEILRFLELEDDGRTEFQAVNEAQTRRLNWLTPYLRRPPGWLKKVVRGVRRLTGIKAPVGTKLLGLSRGGYVSETDELLKAEIRRFYAADNRLVEPRICRPSVALHSAS
jgi:hypothetical protein